jgi:ABC-type lipoprotein release transport system permease subunit
MRSLVSTWRLFARRSGRNWRLLAVLGLGMLMAASLLAAGPIYARTMADLGLTFAVREELSESPGNRAEFRFVPLATEEGTAMRQSIETRIDARIGWFAASSSRHLRTARFTLAQEGELPREQAPLGELQSLTGYEDHVQVLEGRLPAATGPGQPIEVAISRASASAARLAVGQQLVMAEDFDTCAREIPSEDRPPPPPCTPVAAVRYVFPAVITGIVEPLDPEDPFWVVPVERYFEPFRLLPENGPVAPMFTSEETILANFAAAHPGYQATVAWHTFADPEKLSRSNFERAREDLRALYDEFEPVGGASYSPLTTVLQQYGRDQQYQQAPLTILLLEVSAVAIFYVVLVALVIVERHADEIALLRSRGATTLQVGAIYLAEGLLLGAPCLLAAPLMAAVATAGLGLTPTFAEVNGGDLLPARIPFAAFGWAAAGVGLSIIALVVPALVAARKSAVVRRREQARPGVSIIQRYYLDIALAGVAALLLWELNERGNVFTPSPTGGVSSDPLLLASPAILVLAAAALLLRFYPILLRIGARLIGRNAPPALTVGLWQVARSPGNSGRLAVLLTTAVAVGTFAASYAETASRTYGERALYQSGVEFRATAVGSGNMGLNTPGIDAALRELPGVSQATSAMRLIGAPGTAGISGRIFQVLGVDPDRAATMLWFRDDFADRPLRELMASLGAPEQLRGKPLPAGTSSIRVSVNLPETNAQMTLWARIRDRDGNHQMFDMGRLEGVGWREYSTEIRRSYEGALPEPLTLVGLLITEPSNRYNATRLDILFDNLVAIGNGTETVIDAFDGAAPGWSPLPARVSTPDVYEVSTSGAVAGAAGKLSRAAGQSSPAWGLYVAQANVPLPVLGSDSFVAGTGIPVGGTGIIEVANTLVPVRVVASFRLFPTLNTVEGPAVIFNRDHILSWLGIANLTSQPGPNEAWLSLEPGADRAALAVSLGLEPFDLDNTTDRETELRRIASNPLIAAGGAGILYLSFGAVLLLVGVALLVSLWVSVQRRRGEFAVLRAMGLSRGQVVRLLAFEYAVVAILGLVGGAYLGRMVGTRMLSFLNIDEDGRPAEPSFILRTDWLLVLAGAAIVLAVFVFALGIAGRLISRTSDAQALRTE